jgi:hypothetical protein
VQINMRKLDGIQKSHISNLLARKTGEDLWSSLVDQLQRRILELEEARKQCLGDKLLVNERDDRALSIVAMGALLPRLNNRQTAREYLRGILEASGRKYPDGLTIILDNRPLFWTIPRSAYEEAISALSEPKAVIRGEDEEGNNSLATNEGIACLLETGLTSIASYDQTMTSSAGVENQESGISPNDPAVGGECCWNAEKLQGLMDGIVVSLREAGIESKTMYDVLRLALVGDCTTPCMPVKNLMALLGPEETLTRLRTLLGVMQAAK